MSENLRCMTSVYLSHKGRLLLLYRQGGRVVTDMWVGSAGGHFEKDELNDPEACIIREMQEELGLFPSNIEGLRMKYVTLRRTKGEIRQNYYFFAELKGDIERELASNEGELRWFEREELSELKMPFTARFVVDHYLNVGMNDDKLYGAVADGEKMVFIEMPMF